MLPGSSRRLPTAGIAPERIPDLMRTLDATRTAVCGALLSAAVAVAMVTAAALHGPAEPAPSAPGAGAAHSTGSP